MNEKKIILDIVVKSPFGVDYFYFSISLFNDIITLNIRVGWKGLTGTNPLAYL
jgi:hypothetical protein